MEKGLPPDGVPVPVQFEAIAYVPVTGSVDITPSRDVVFSPVNVPVVESNVSWVTAALLGLPLLSVVPCTNPYVPLSEAFEQVAPAAERTAKLARKIIPAMPKILEIMMLSSSPVFCWRLCIEPGVFFWPKERQPAAAPQRSRAWRSSLRSEIIARLLIKLTRSTEPLPIYEPTVPTSVRAPVVVSILNIEMLFEAEFVT